jgi:DNA invertase Pin-like site-specific DNA recombinase
VSGILIGYARTSTVEQQAGFDAQLRDLRAGGCTKFFKEQVSSVAERKELEAALDYAREDDTLVVTKLDRLARSARHLLEILDTLQGKGVGLRILNLGGDTVDTRGATGRLLLNLLAAVAQFEREMMLERQREGIAAAKAAGKYSKVRAGRAKKQATEIRRLHVVGKNLGQIARELKIGRASVRRVLEALVAQNGINSDTDLVLAQ